MADYELLYFPARGRAEQIRLVFAHAEAPYTENPVANWPELKPNTPFGRLPILIERSEGEELELAESGAIMRHLGRCFDLAGSDARQQAICDSLLDFVADERTKHISVAYAGTLGTTEDEIAAYWKQFPDTLGKFERALARSSSTNGWLVGDSPTVADLAAFDYLDASETIRPGCLDGHDALQGFVAKVRALPTLETFLAERTRP